MVRAGALALLAIISGSACVPDAGRPSRAAELAPEWYRLIVDAEDARPTGGDGLATLLAGVGLDDPFLRRTAVRALGRLENPALSRDIARHLGDPDPDVRTAAAEALAQSVHGVDGTGVLDELLVRVSEETDAGVRGALAQSLGRLTLNEVHRHRVEETLIELGGEGVDEPMETLVGVALGFESLVRRSGGGLSRPAADLLIELMTYRVDDDDQANQPAPGRVRALASSTLGRGRRMSAELMRQALRDPEPEVRRSVVPYLSAAPPLVRDGLIRRALADTTTRVVTEVVRYVAQLTRTQTRCEWLLAAATPGIAPAVRISALEAMAQPCPTVSLQRATLVQAASEVGEAQSNWQPAAAALLSLARLDPGATREVLPGFVAHENPFVRAWAARAAAAIRDVSTLSALTSDPSPNVRTAAVQGLFAVQGHGLDAFLLGQLEDDDPQLLMAVARLLEGAPERSTAASTLLSTFERISLAGRQTWRDPRLALLERIAELGDESFLLRLTPFLADYDPVVANAVADLLGTWTGGEYTATPTPLPRAAFPDRATLEALESLALTFHMRGSGRMVIELLADQATTNVARVVMLAGDGYYDGLSFHRWAPNFVLQGGSPGANEYHGDGPYTRDEVGGLPHWRGSVGISTRGRDTGDAQLFINLVDNPRLNHDYTVIGRVVEGYDVLDSLLEGAVIERAEVAGDRDQHDPA